MYFLTFTFIYIKLSASTFFSLFNFTRVTSGIIWHFNFNFIFIYFAMQFIWSFISLITVQTSVAADIFLKLPAWEDMTAENKTQRCCKTCLASGTTVCAGKTAQANISWYSKFISSVLRITQSIWQLAHTDKWGKSSDIHKQWHRKSLFRVSCQIMYKIKKKSLSSHMSLVLHRTRTSNFNFAHFVMHRHLAPNQ